MKFLELKIIPPLQVLVLVVVALLTHRYLPFFHHHVGIEPWTAIALMAIAALMLFTAVFQFYKHKTTINPVKVNDAQTLMTSGVYAYSRNPIYLADLLLIAALVIWLGQWVNLILPVIFIWYCGRFQIAPEEKALRDKFQLSYDQYLERTRRWL